MHHHDHPSDPELSLALAQRNALARSLVLRTRRAATLHPTRTLHTLSQLSAALARRRPTAPTDQLPDFLLDAADRVLDRAAAGEPLPWQRPGP